MNREIKLMTVNEKAEPGTAKKLTIIVRKSEIETTTSMGTTSAGCGVLSIPKKKLHFFFENQNQADALISELIEMRFAVWGPFDNHLLPF